MSGFAIHRSRSNMFPMKRLAAAALLVLLPSAEGWAETLRFETSDAMKAPLKHGIYRLYADSRLIYIGKAVDRNDSIRGRLIAHLRGDSGPCTQAATAFEYEVRHNIISMERLYLAHHRAIHGTVPKCNAGAP